jgi:uroporphyrinogen decarboxylase
MRTQVVGPVDGVALSEFNDTFLKACRRERTDYVPVWFMRQAGRSLPGYRKLREKYGVLELTQTPELAAEVSMEPVKRLGVDAAILFADIMLLPMAMGVDVKIVEGVGPVIDSPIEGGKDVFRLVHLQVERIGFLQETIRILRKNLNVPVIGFSGAPFTLASYLIEGKPSRNWIRTKRFMFEQPDAWSQLMTTLSDGIIGYLQAQIEAGAQAVQLFDSWVGALSAADYRRYVLPHVQRIFQELGDSVPRIHFGTDTAGMLKDFSNVTAEVVGLDWRIDLSRARELVPGRALQGNLDPITLLGSREVLERRVDEMFNDMPDRRGWIFNLGHGVPPEADDKLIKQLVEYVHAKK